MTCGGVLIPGLLDLLVLRFGFHKEKDPSYTYLLSAIVATSSMHTAGTAGSYDNL